MLLQETGEFRLVTLDRVSFVTDPASIVVRILRNTGTSGTTTRREEWAEDYHRRKR